VTRSNSQPHVVILLENLPVSRDRRVWREAEALRDAGFLVTTICPADGNRRSVEVVDGIEVRSFKPAPEPSTAAGFVREYGTAFVRMSAELLQVMRAGPIHAVQACNPPDIFFPLAALLKLRGIPFVFDQHDLTPELYETRFGRKGLTYWVLQKCERLTYLFSARVVSTNASYRSVAISRGSLKPENVVVVRNGPEPVSMQAGPANAALKGKFAHLVVWMGNMGPQDGVDQALEAVRYLVHDLGRTDCRFVFIGKGDVLDDLRSMSFGLGIDEWVHFTGWIPDAEAFLYLSTATLGLSADPPGPLNDKSTMNKTLEYMSFGLAVVAHDLTETRASAGDSALYADTGDPAGLARAVYQLLDEPERREAMGRIGRQRIVERLSWPHQRQGYVAMYKRLLAFKGSDRIQAGAETESTNRPSQERQPELT